MLIYRLDAPQDIRRVSFGGRFYNRAPKSRIDLLYSLDAGKTWTECWSLTQTAPPWDVIHHEVAHLPAGHRSVWLQYRMNTIQPSPSGCSIYAVRMEANYAPPPSGFTPIQVTFSWSESQQDRTLVKRSHTQTIPKLPFQYRIQVRGEDHPIVHSLRVSRPGAAGLERGLF